ncbi:MAG: lipopolysaccharide assembly protein LapA domain-containing protein [bacterium]
MQLYLIVGLALAALIAVFAMMNSTEVAVNFPFVQPVDTSVPVLIFVSAIAGALVMLIIGVPGRLRRRRETRSLRLDLKSCREENQLLSGRLDELVKKREPGQPPPPAGEKEMS